LEVSSAEPTVSEAPSAETQMIDLQKTADFYVFQKAVRTLWRTCIILGIMGIVLGVFYTQILSPINIIAVPIGVLLAIAGIRARTTPKPSSLLISGIALSTMTAWLAISTIINIIIALFSQIAPAPVIGAITFGNIIIGSWFYIDVKNLLTLYRRFSANPPAKPTDQKLQEMKNLTRSIIKARVGKNASPDNVVIWFNISNMEDLKNEKGQIINDSGNYRAKLSRTLVIIVSSDCKYINFLRPDEFDLILQGRFGILGRRFIEVLFKGSRFAGCVTSKVCFQRYELWKNTVDTL
jgi:hypothetical protein